MSNKNTRMKNSTQNVAIIPNFDEIIMDLINNLMPNLIKYTITMILKNES